MPERETAEHRGPEQKGGSQGKKMEEGSEGGGGGQWGAATGSGEGKR